MRFFLLRSTETWTEELIVSHHAVSAQQGGPLERGEGGNKANTKKTVAARICKVPAAVN